MAAGDTRAARRYASALFGMARKSDVDAVSQDLAHVLATAHNEPQLMEVLTHPRITEKRKNELTAQIFGDLRPTMQAFLRLLITRDRVGLLPAVGVHFEKLVDEWKGEADAEATTAVELSQSQKDALVKKLEATTGYKKIRLLTQVDPSILGGMTVRVGDHLIDGSITTQLQMLREQLKRVRIGGDSAAASVEVPVE